MATPVRLPKRAKHLEFWVAVAVIASTGTLLLHVLARFQEDSERVTVETTIRNLNSGLRWTESELIVQGREAERSSLRRANPTDWLAKRPDGYVERERVAPGDIAPGQWVWERAARLLHYRPRYPDRVRVEGGETLAWRVVGGAGEANLRPGALRIEALRPYEWQP